MQVPAVLLQQRIQHLQCHLGPTKSLGTGVPGENISILEWESGYLCSGPGWAANSWVMLFGFHFHHLLNLDLLLPHQAFTGCWVL